MEFADDVFTPTWHILASRQVNDRTSVFNQCWVKSSDIKDGCRKINQRHEGVGLAHSGNTGDVRDEGDVVNIVVHHRSLVVEAVGAGEFSVVRAEEDCGVIKNSQFARHVHDSADFEVDHGHVSPVDSDELLPLIVIEGRC